jgi:hypothetical protein
MAKPRFLHVWPVDAGASSDRGTATAGDRGTATAGYRGTATAGYGGTATAGDRGTATAGYRGTATAGYRGTATAGYGGTATAGYGGTATAGYGGTLIIFRRHPERDVRRPIVAVVGEDGVEANIAYRLSENGLFVPVPLGRVTTGPAWPAGTSMNIKVTPSS